jgi:hypothetical protein
MIIEVVVMLRACNDDSGIDDGYDDDDDRGGSDGDDDDGYDNDDDGCGDDDIGMKQFKTWLEEDEEKRKSAENLKYEICAD